MRKLMNPKAVADILGIPVRGVYRLIQVQRLKSIRIGRLIRIPQEDLDEYLTEQRNRALI